MRRFPPPQPVTRLPGLEPYQIVRSLELVQDRLAGGDHASQPMQRKLLEMIDQRFATKEGSRFEN